MSIYDDKSMEGMTPAEQATKAIKHLLQRVRDDDRVYHLIGLGSESFSLLTEAYCSLTGSDLAVLRKSLSSAGAEV
jgi:hypothetical protein